MPAEDLKRVHRRYITVSNTFKSSWTFHQFIQGLRKIFADVPASECATDFQTVYGELKLVSENLSETSIDVAAEQLDRVEAQLAPLVDDLLAVDQRISPGLLRQFFQRVRSFDDNILTQLVKFYLHTKGQDGWNLDRLDKADFLSTKVAEEYNDERGAFVLCDRTELRELAQGFWNVLATGPIADQEVENSCQQIRTFASEIQAIESIDELHHNSLIDRYRELKHSLGDAFFQPRIWPDLLETNLVMKNHFQRLYRRDEQRIIAEYQQVFELEREVQVDDQLGEELSQFRDAVERFESQLQGENVRLGELAELREKVRELVPKLQPASESSDPVVMPEELREPAPEVIEETEDGYVEERYQAIVSALDDTNPTLDPKKIALQPEIFALAIGPREVIAYRRIFGGGGCDRGTEQFVLRAAALRFMIERQVEEIRGILDDTAATQEAPIFAQARKTAQLGDLFLRRFEHRIEQTVLNGDGQDARALQFLKIRLMRSFSGLWLLVHRS